MSIVGWTRTPPANQAAGVRASGNKIPAATSPPTVTVFQPVGCNPTRCMQRQGPQQSCYPSNDGAARHVDFTSPSTMPLSSNSIKPCHTDYYAPTANPNVDARNVNPQLDRTDSMHTIRGSERLEHCVRTPQKHMAAAPRSCDPRCAAPALDAPRRNSRAKPTSKALPRWPQTL